MTYCTCRSKLEPLEKSLGRIKVGLLPKQGERIYIMMDLSSRFDRLPAKG